MPYLAEIKNMVENGSTDEAIRNHLVTKYGFERGASIANIRRFCHENGLRRQRVTDTELEAAVLKAIQEVHFYEHISVIHNVIVSKMAYELQNKSSRRALCTLLISDHYVILYFWIVTLFTRA